jgi:hypothetical protein
MNDREIASIKKRRSAPWLAASLLVGTGVGLLASMPIHSLGWSGDFSFAAFADAYLKMRANDINHFLFPTQGPAAREALSAFPWWMGTFHTLVVAGWIGAGWFLRGMLAKRDDTTFIRGGLLFDENGQEVFARDTAPKTKGKPTTDERDVEFLPGIPFDDDKWKTHVVMLGQTGAGKTTVFLNWLQQIVRKKRDRLLLVDIKSDFITFWKHLSILDPADSRTLYWDIASDIRTGPEADSFAAMMVPVGKGDAVWPKAARLVVAGMIAKLQATKPMRWTWGDLAAELKRPGPEIRSDLATFAPEKMNAMPEAAVTQAGVEFNIASEPLDIINGIAAAYALLERSGDLSTRKFSFREWAGNDDPKHRKIILRRNGRTKTQSDAFIAAALDYLSNLVGSPELKDKSPTRTWVFFDEFAQVPKIDSLQAILAVGRSRNFRLILGTQEKSQITNKYGAEGGSIYTTGPGISITGRLVGPAADDASKFLGSQEVATPTVSTNAGISGTSSSHSYQEKTRALVHSAELGTVGADEKGVTAYAKIGDRVYLLRWPFPTVGEARPKERPWTHLKGGYALLARVFNEARAAGFGTIRTAMECVFKANESLKESERFTVADFANMLVLHGLGENVVKTYRTWPELMRQIGDMPINEALKHGKHDDNGLSAFLAKDRGEDEVLIDDASCLDDDGEENEDNDEKAEQIVPEKVTSDERAPLQEVATDRASLIRGVLVEGRAAS